MLYSNLECLEPYQELGNSGESYINVIQGPRESLSDFWQRLTKGVQIGVADPEAR